MTAAATAQRVIASHRHVTVSRPLIATYGKPF